MRFFANVFLMLFFADGVVSLSDELASLFLQLPALSELRDFLASLVVVMAFALYLSLGIDRRLPKGIFLPLIFFVLVCPLTAWFFPAVAESPVFRVLMPTGQVFLGMLPLFRFRDSGGAIFLMPKEMFETPFFSLRNTLIFGIAVNIVVLPLALVLFSLSAADSYLQVSTSGFMRLSPEGIQMTERVYRRGNQTIRLAAMIHVGDKGYYEDMVKSVAPGRTIVLAEGVTDEKNLLRNRPDYGKFAGFLGLASQEKMHFRAKLIGNLEKPSPQAKGEGRKGAETAEILRADVDISSFRPETVHFLDALGKHLKENDSPLKGFFSFNAWAQKNITPQTHGIIMDDILYGRNKVLIGYLGKALARYDTVVIPWGALHMPEIEAEVLRLGFKLRQEQERVSIDLRKMLEGSNKPSRRAIQSCKNQ